MKLYTDQGPIFPLINNLLRTNNDPFTLFHIHLLFKDLFWTIKRIYKKEKELNKKTKYPRKKFKAYRATRISESEIDFFKKRQGEAGSS